MTELQAAVASLTCQGVALEIVIIHSATLLDADPAWLPREVRHLRYPELLPTGAARNAGIAASLAPFVAFLAGDSRALAGWAAGRLSAHRGGAERVAGALVNPSPGSLTAWAGAIVLHHRRWARVPAHEALLYGCSYARTALARVGGFRGDLAAGEDTELHARLDEAGSRALWAPAVRATHPYPTRLAELLREQFRRGENAARAWLALGDRARAGEISQSAYARAARAMRFAMRYAEPADRGRVALASPLVALASRSYSRGARRALGSF